MAVMAQFVKIVIGTNEREKTSMELKVLEKEIGSLAINYEELKKELAVSLEKYKGLVVTEDEITKAKATRASLNKVAKMIDERRKELKKEFLKPYEAVEAQTKELVSMINEVNSTIDEQIKEFERQEKFKKTQEISTLWNSFEYEKVKFSQIFRDEWLNKTYSMKKIEEDMKAFIETVESGLKTIDSLIKDVNVAETIKAKYLIRLDLNCVIAEYEAEQRAKELIKESQKEPEKEVQDAEIVNQELPTQDEKKYSFRFEVIGTKTQIDQLAAYLKTSGLKIQILD